LSLLQMFWNSMLQKSWRWHADEIVGEHKGNILHIHNANKEAAWIEALKWEKSHCHKCRTGRLRRCAGDIAALYVRCIIGHYDSVKVHSDFRLALLNVRHMIDWFSAVCACVRMTWRRRCLPKHLRNHPDSTINIPEARDQYILHHCLTYSCLY
uniref:Holocytochrome c-type synthase n=1 Tax=Taenia asiatica TaxID=60517 RepID=A0A0R3WHH2_TAEAS